MAETRSLAVLAVGALLLGGCDEKPRVEPDLCVFATREVMQTDQLAITGQSTRLDPGSEVAEIEVALTFTGPDGAAGTSKCGFLTRNDVTRLTTMEVNGRELPEGGLKALQAVVSRENWKRSMK